MNADNQSREAFEAELLSHYPSWTREALFNKVDSGRYSSLVTETAWRCWQASRKQALESLSAQFNQPHQEYFGDAIQDVIKELK